MSELIDNFIKNEDIDGDVIHTEIVFEMKKYYVELAEKRDRNKSSNREVIDAQNKFLKIIDQLCDVKFSVHLKKLTEIERMLLLEKIGCVFDFSVKELKYTLLNRNIELCDLMYQLGCNRGKNGNKLYNDFIYSIYLHSDEFHNFLREHIIDVNAKDNRGRTPLMKSFVELGPDMTCILLSIGADVKVQDINGDTALHIAASRDAEIVELLLKFGSDKNIKNKRGQLAIDVAKESNNLEALKILK